MPKIKFIRYLLVGGLSYVLEVTTIVLLHKFLSLSSVASVAISFWVGFLVAFELQKKVTFSNHEKSGRILSKQLSYYGMLVAWNYIFTLSLVGLLNNSLSVVLIRTIAIAIITLWNYSIYKVIFKETVDNKSMPTSQTGYKLSISRRLKPSRVLVKKLSSPVFGKLYALGSILTLGLTTILWSINGSSVQSTNADQLVSPYMFDHLDTFRGASFPGQHTQLIKWPIFLLVRWFGLSSLSFKTCTVILCLLTVGALVFILHKIERRPLVLGTLCLGIASVLLLIPAQPYLSGLLPINMAMLTTRNIEYVFYIGCFIAILRSHHIRSKQFLIACLALGLLLASDKLFMSLSLVGMLMAFLTYALTSRWKLVSVAVRCFTATLLASIVSFGLLSIIGVTKLTNIASSGIGPYALVDSPHRLAQGSFYAISSLLTNFGANPAYDATEIRHIPNKLGQHLLNLTAFSYLVNLAILIAGIYAAWQLVAASLSKKMPKDLKDDPSYRLALMLLWATLGSFALFAISKHSYPVDARYVSLSLFSIFIALAVVLSKRKIDPYKTVWIGLVIVVSILIGISSSVVTSNKQIAALTVFNSRNSSVALAVQEHPVDILVGDYWRVIPTRSLAHDKIAVLPLSDCITPREVLSSSTWQPNLDSTSFAYLLSLEKGLTEFPTCSLDQITATYGKPNASLVIDGSYSEPKELLLFYDHGAHKSAPKVSASDVTATVEPIPIEELPYTSCKTPTVMNIVAHEDDDLLFMNPDLIKDVKAGHCLRTVYMTSGDAGSSIFYWLGREKGSEAAYSKMISDSTNIWISRIVKLGDNQYITVANPKGNSTISLIFMHLPDGNLQGQGFKASNNQSLAALADGSLRQIKAIYGGSTYSANQLTSALADLMSAFHPSEIHTQSKLVSTTYPDHSDHTSASNFTERAYIQYEKNQYNNEIMIPIKHYIGYPIHDLPANIFNKELDSKIGIFLEYAKYDDSVCQSVSQCSKQTTYGTYLRRQYVNE